ncbi:hypothetical protein HanRHA438_Chr08g0369931 [Helianthus annuus]|nr:hypothetical protein HanRHA438_Chr08g0369931 [Helianthus annuus]
MCKPNVKCYCNPCQVFMLKCKPPNVYVNVDVFMFNVNHVMCNPKMYHVW